MRFLGTNTIKILVLVGFITFSLAIESVPAAEGDYPNRPVNLIVGFDPGASASISAHIFADGVQKQLAKPQPFIINHKPGASGMLGADYFMKQPADGYNLLWATQDHPINVLIAKKGTPEAVFDTIEKIFKQTAKDPVSQSGLARAGFVPLYLGPEETKNMVYQDFEIAYQVSGQLGLGGK